MIRPVALALFALAALPATAMAAAPIEGSWTNPSGAVTVRIAPCGGGRYCGRVTAASAHAREDAAQAGTDRLVGTELMSGLEEVGPGEWRGEVFVPDRNIHAQGNFRLMSASRLSVEGCAVGGLLCKSQMWTKVSGASRRHARR